MRMIFRAGRIAAGLAVLALGLAPLAARAQAQVLTWSADAADEPGAVHLTLTYRPSPNSRSSYGRTLSLSDLAGLTDGQLRAPANTPVRFRMTRDAGVFDCEGVAHARVASGTCDFHENPAFVRTLQQRGAGTATSAQLLDLAMSEIGVAYLDELRRQRYAPVDVATLVRAGQHGVNLKILTGMDAAGYRVGDLNALIRMRDHGVDPRYVGELRAAGISGLSPEDLVRMRDHGVSARFMQEVKAAGYARLPADQLVYLRDHGVSGRYLQELRDAGYANLSVNHIVALRDHGVPASFAAGLSDLGYRVSPEELVRMRDHGVTTEFVRRVSNGGRLDVDQLIQLRDRGGR